MYILTKNSFIRKIYWNILFKWESVKHKYLVKKYSKKYTDYKDDEYNMGALKFIWGIKSSDDLSSNEASFCTLNDLDICFDRDKKQYFLEVETIYMFDDTFSECAYYANLLNAFTDYMKENNLDINKNYNTFMSGLEISFSASSIEELYSKFKIVVTGFCSVCEERGNYEYH